MSAAPAATAGRRSLAPELAWVALLGALHSLPFVFTSAWWLQPLLVAGLARRLIQAPTVARAALLGWVFAAAWLGAGIWWLFISMHRYGGLPAWLAALAVALLALLLALYLGLASALFARWRRGGVLRDALLFAALWLAAELARARLFTGFPWLASGYAHVDSPLAALAPWAGVYGVGFVAALIGALLALGRGGWGRRAVAGASLLVLFIGAGVLAWAGRGGFTTSAGRVGVTLIQTNVAQDEKFSAERMPAALAWLASALAEARGPLVLAPETAIPLLPEQLDPAWWGSVTAPYRTGQRALLVGAPLGSYEKGYTNSAIGISPGGDYRYDKHHLVPFGEFIPPGFRWFVDMMRMPLGDFSRGPLAAPSFAVALGQPNAAQRVAPNICYEDLFGEELAARFATPEGAPTMFANLSNIGWFGDTIAVDQHLHISRMRSLEFERPMLRATNTGATAVVDHRGRVTQMLTPFTQGTLDGEVEGRHGLTPYAAWASHWGLWPLLGLALALTMLCASRRRARL